MKFLAIIGVIIIIHILFFVLDWEDKPVPKRDVKGVEIITFLIATIVFFIVNFLIVSCTMIDFQFTILELQNRSLWYLVRLSLSTNVILLLV